MSSNVTPINPQDLPGLISSNIIVNYVEGSGLAWYIYEYLLTLHLEVEVVWKSKIGLTAILFLINRYAFVLSWSSELVSTIFFASTTQSCRIFILFGDIFNLVNVTTISGIFILRAYAICAQNRWILAILIALFSTRFGLAIWAFVVNTNNEVLVSIPKVDSIGNCASTSSFKPSAIELILTVVFDATIFFVTLSRTWTLSRQAKSAGIRGGLGDLLLRDGSLYFGRVLGEELFSPLEAILTNRLILNLRTHDRTNDPSSPSTKTDIFFRNAYGRARNRGNRASFMDTVLGNIGAPLRVDDDEEDDITESGEGEQGMELVLTQTSLSAGSDEQNISAEPNIRNTDGMERPLVEMGNGDEGNTQAGGELQV